MRKINRFEEASLTMQIQDFRYAYQKAHLVITSYSFAFSEPLFVADG